MALLNPPKKKTPAKPPAKTTNNSVEDLARAGNEAAQRYLAGTLTGSTEITNDNGGKLTASDVVGQVASGNVGGYNVSQRSQTLGQIAAASGYTTPSQISTIAPNLTSTSLVAGNKYQGTYNPATVGYRSSMTNSKGELFYKPEEAKKQAEYLTKQKMAPLMSSTPIGDQVSVADGIAAQEKARALLDKYGTMAVTQPEWQENINTMLTAGIENINKLNPTPREPIFTTKAQQDKLSYDTTGTEQARYDALYKELGQGKLQEQRIDVMKQLQAVQEVYQKVIDEIKANPNLPKGLAAQRLTDVFEDQKFAASALIAQLDIIDEQIGYNNDEIDRQLGIFEYDKSQEDKIQERKLSQFEYLVSSGAVAALTPSEMQSWSDMTGVPISAIKKMQEISSDPEKDYVVSSFTDDYGNVTQVFVNKKDPTDRMTIDLGPIGNATSGSGSKPTIQYIYNEKNTPADVQADLVAVLKDPGFNKTKDEFIAMYPEFDSEYLAKMYTTYYENPQKESEKGKGWWDATKGAISSAWNWLVD